MATIAATYLSGVTGTAAVDAVTVPINAWKLTLSCATFDATNSETSGWMFPEAAVKSGKGSFTAIWKVASGGPSFAVGDVVPLTLTVKTGVTYTFNAVMTSVDVNMDVKGGVTFTVNFESQGAVTPPA